jgi:hypothetical protein
VPEEFEGMSERSEEKKWRNKRIIDVSFRSTVYFS